MIAKTPLPCCAVFSGKDAANKERMDARRHGRKAWYSGYSIRIWKIERACGF